MQGVETGVHVARIGFGRDRGFGGVDPAAESIIAGDRLPINPVKVALQGVETGVHVARIGLGRKLGFGGIDTLAMFFYRRSERDGDRHIRSLFGGQPGTAQAANLTAEILKAHGSVTPGSRRKRPSASLSCSASA